MNERSKLLAQQAGYHPDVYELCKPGMEKFAELLILECAGIAFKSGSVHNKSIDATIEADRIYHKIKKHFGVEE